MALRPPRRSLRDYALPFLIILALGVLVALLVRLIFQMNNGATPLNGENASSITVTEVSGEVEVYLPAIESWKILDTTGARLAASERIRTSVGASAELRFDDGSVLVMGPVSELRIDELANSFRGIRAAVSLTRGTALVDVRDARGSMHVTTRLLQTSNADGIYLIATDERGEEVSASVLDGGMIARIIDPQNTRTPTISSHEILAGNTLQITERRVNLLRIGGDIELIADTPASIADTALYRAGIASLPARIASDDDVTTPDEIDTPTTPSTPPTPVDTPATLTAPRVTSHADLAVVTSEPVELRGSVPAGTTAVEVSANGAAPYRLTAFRAGETSFLYRARSDFGNLRVGQNTYQIVAIRDTTRSEATTHRIIFESTGSEENTTPTPTTPVVETPEPSTANDTTPATDSSESAAAPTVSEPLDGAVVTSAPVAFRGTVPAGTVAVEVNGYRLTSGFTGGTSWFYNAAPAYENLSEGENSYTITAIAADESKSSTTISITYTPAE